MVVYAAIWFFMGCIAGTVAESKGHRFWEWFFASAILGPFGVIWSLTLDRTP